MANSQEAIICVFATGIACGFNVCVGVVDIFRNITRMGIGVSRVGNVRVVLGLRQIIEFFQATEYAGCDEDCGK